MFISKQDRFKNKWTKLSTFETRKKNNKINPKKIRGKKIKVEISDTENKQNKRTKSNAGVLKRLIK